MHIKTISAEYQRKFNVGDFESAALSAGAWADIDQGEDAETCMTVLQEFCKETVRQQSQQILRHRKGHGVEYAMLEDDHNQLQEAVIEFARANKGNAELISQLAESEILKQYLPSN